MRLIAIVVLVLLALSMAADAQGSWGQFRDNWNYWDHQQFRTYDQFNQITNRWIAANPWTQWSFWTPIPEPGGDRLYGNWVSYWPMYR